MSLSNKVILRPFWRGIVCSSKDGSWWRLLSRVSLWSILPKQSPLFVWWFKTLMYSSAFPNEVKCESRWTDNNVFFWVSVEFVEIICAKWEIHDVREPDVLPGLCLYHAKQQWNAGSSVLLSENTSWMWTFTLARLVYLYITDYV